MIVQRISGTAPRTSLVSAEVVASIQSVAPDTMAPREAGYGAGNPGAITQDDRQLIVMAADLKGKRFPLPLRKNDRVIVKETGEAYTIARADPLKRAMAGAIEAVITGVS